MSRRRLERLLNLTMCLMATSRFLTVSEIGELVEGYTPGDTADEQEAFRRMFERDKQYLRDIGIPLETGSDSYWSDEVGYRIRRGDYALPEISLDPDEAAALGLAAQLWSSRALADASASALRKLAAGGIRTLPGPDGLEPRVATTEPAFAPCLAAVQAGRAVRFPYRKVEQTEARERHVEPWGVVSWRGRWYLVGHDRDRRAPRVFRLSRVTGAVRAVGPAGAVRVPDGVDLRALVSASAPSPEPTRTAILCVRPGAGHALRRYARALPGDGPRHLAPGSDEGSLAAAAAGMDWVELDYSDTEQLARWIAGYGADVLVEQPAQLRAEVVRRLTDAARAHDGIDRPRPVAKPADPAGSRAFSCSAAPASSPATSVKKPTGGRKRQSTAVSPGEPTGDTVVPPVADTVARDPAVPPMPPSAGASDGEAGRASSGAATLPENVP
ncbi:transcriptional regulator-like protein [Candidatus Protofrankia datiscae]|uniref:Transcriptional regulator-like protein n=2 Tax=Frankiaceae TaxID=74712 RepID=F8B4D6_9ACTN|nr:transcriptional regulator-like protein [Candidatus Protofrankia datiscae]